MPFMYCDPPSAIVRADSGSISGPSAQSRANPLAQMFVRLASGVSFTVGADERSNGQEWTFSQHLRKTDHIKVCFGPPMGIPGHPADDKYHDRFAIVGDVEAGSFAYVLTQNKR